jgi:ankyrin repeat protein
MENAQTIQAAIQAFKEGDKSTLGKLLEDAFSFKERKILNINDILSLLSKPEIKLYLNDPAFKDTLDEIIQSAFESVVFKSQNDNEKEACIELMKLFFKTEEIRKHIIDINNTRIRIEDKDGKPAFKKGSLLFIEALSCLEIADILIENGADVYACGPDGQSAFTSLTMDFAKLEARAKREAYETERAKAKDQAIDEFFISSIKLDSEFQSFEPAKQAQLIATYRAKAATREYPETFSQKEFIEKKDSLLDFIKLLVAKYKIDPLKRDATGNNIASIDAKLNSTELKKIFKTSIDEALKEEQEKLVLASKTENAQKIIEAALTKAITGNNQPELFKFILSNENTKPYAQLFLNQLGGIFSVVVSYGKDKFELAKILMENGCDPYDGSRGTRQGKSALVQAVEENNVETLRFLLNDLKLDPYKLDSNGVSVIRAVNNIKRSSSFHKRQEQYVELLKEVAPHVDFEKEKIRLTEIAKEHPEEIGTEFHEALDKRDMGIIRFLLSNDATKRYIDLNAKHWATLPLLGMAISHGDFELAKLFIDNGANIEEHFNLWGGEGGTLSYLTFVAGWDCDSQKESEHQINCLNFLVKTLGLDPYKPDAAGRTAITIAKENNNKALLAFLKPFITPEKEKQRLNSMSKEAVVTAFRAAVLHGDLETVKQMMEIKQIKETILLKINELDKDGTPLLMQAFKKGNSEDNAEIARILVANGADPYISERDRLGNSLLTWAATEKNSALLKFLIDKKAQGGLELDPYKADSRGRTVVTIAKEAKDKNLLDLLKPMMTEKDLKEEKTKQYCLAIKTYIEALEPVIKELQQKVQKAPPTLKIFNIKDSIRLEMVESLKKYLLGIDNLEHPKKPPEKIKQELLEIEKHLAEIGKKPGNDPLAKTYTLISQGIKELLDVPQSKQIIGQPQSHR